MSESLPVRWNQTLSHVSLVQTPQSVPFKCDHHCSPSGERTPHLATHASSATSRRPRVSLCPGPSPVSSRSLKNRKTESHLRRDFEAAPAKMAVPNF
jgi:hypothetical protein